MDFIKQIATHIESLGGRAYMVGGCVRDKIIGVESKDIDIEVFGIDYNALYNLLKEYGSPDEVGKSFGVIKLKHNDIDYDFSIPRRERKSGSGHKGFDIEVDHTMSIEKAASRRDFTINAIYEDILTGTYTDPFGGREHLLNGRLEACTERFMEDPLRVLRGMQFVSRFDLTESSIKTLTYFFMCAKEYHTLPKERIWEEWKKWALKSIIPSLGLSLIKDSTWIQFYPELNDLIDCPQDPEYHPEGDVFIHTQCVVDAMKQIIFFRSDLSSEDRLILMFAALCHDLGKPATTKFENGRWRSKRHTQEGEEPTISFLTSIGCPDRIIHKVVPLVKEHLVHCSLQKVTNKIVRRLAERLHPANIHLLSLLVLADMNGRPPLEGNMPKIMEQLMNSSRELNISHSKTNPLVKGRHILNLVDSGPEMGSILRKCYNAQLDGVFDNLDDGIEYVKTIIKKGE